MIQPGYQEELPPPLLLGVMDVGDALHGELAQGAEHHETVLLQHVSKLHLRPPGRGL